MNVILGKLIPAGTGMKRYRNTRLSTDAHLRRNEVKEEIEEIAPEADTNVEVVMDEQVVEEIVNPSIEE